MRMNTKEYSGIGVARSVSYLSTTLLHIEDKGTEE